MWNIEDKTVYRLKNKDGFYVKEMTERLYQCKKYSSISGTLFDILGVNLV